MYYPYEWELVIEPTREELLLAEAKRRYPIGTKVVDLCIPTHCDEIKSHKCSKNMSQFTPKETIWFNNGDVPVYDNGRWAEIVKEETMSTERKIIGYKILKLIWGYEGIKWSPGNKIDITNKESLPYFKSIGILDDTSIFEPIYKSAYPEITINGYKGEFFDKHIKFGCASISKEFIMQINDILSNRHWENCGYKSIESVTIGKGTFTKGQIKEIAEYYLRK